MDSDAAVEEFCPVINLTPEELEAELLPYAQYRRLSPEEIGALAKRLADSTDEDEVEALTEEMVRGLCGGKRDA